MCFRKSLIALSAKRNTCDEIVATPQGERTKESRIVVKLIYADTSVWNCLHDQKVDPLELFSVLARRDVLLVLGFNVVYEFAKLFFPGYELKVRRGRDLFEYLKLNLDLKIPVVKENVSLLKDEALDASGQRSFDFCFANRSDCEALVREVNNLCEAHVSPGRDEFILKRKALVESSRASARNHFKNRPDVEERLAALDEAELPEFLITEYATRQGELIILGHLVNIFSGSTPADLLRAAKDLSSSSKYRFARALARGSLYLNWRCAKFGSIRDDLYDDMFHVVNAAYSDVFATTDTDQANLARHAIEATQVISCDGNKPISDQLMSEL